MKVIKPNSIILEQVASSNGLSSYLSNLSVGRKATPRSWLYEHTSAEDVVQQWIPIMKACNAKSRFGKVFSQFDLAQLAKFGPQGEVPPITSPEAQEVIEKLFTTSSFDRPDALEQYYPYCKQFAIEVFGRRLCTHRPRALTRVVDDMASRDTLSTNSGYPRFTRRNSVKEQEIKDAQSGAAYDYPAIILFRHYLKKLRPVWMFPMSMNLIEFTFSQEIQDALLNSPASWVRQYLSPWLGFEHVKQTLTSQWQSQNIVGGDTTAMDAHMRPAQIMLVFEIVKWLFQKQYWDDLKKCLLHITSIPLLVDCNKMIVGTHGLASGSGWTQLTETVLQCFMAWMEKSIGQGIGDDFYWISDMDADATVNYLSKYGLPANPEKQTISATEVHFLQRLFHQGFVSRESSSILGAYYPTVRALNSMLQPEKFHRPEEWNKDMFAIRNYMILENCVDDPSFDELVRFVCKGHSYMSQFAKQTPQRLSSLQKIARLIPGLNPSYNQEKRFKPLSEFESIKLGRQL